MYVDFDPGFWHGPAFTFPDLMAPGLGIQARAVFLLFNLCVLYAV